MTEHNRQQSAPRAKRTIAQRLQSSTARYSAYCAFVVLMLLFAGGSREDILTLVVVRPLAVLFAGYALIGDGQPRVRVGAPFWMLVALALIMVVQLIPLPHSIWSALPGRELIAANDRVIGVGEIWRTLSLSPNRTWNSLFSLIVPFAAFALVSAQWPIMPQRLLLPILLMAAVSAIVGVLQVLGPDGGPLYFYRITNPENAVGLFSNRNHHAIFLASLIPMAGFVALATDAGRSWRMLVVAASGGGILFAILLILATGSRAGALSSVVSVIATATLCTVYMLKTDRARGRHRARTVRLSICAVAALVICGAALTYLASSSAAFERLFAEQLDSELRVRLLPQLWHMVQIFFPVGSGYGSFELAYKSLETVELLHPRYLNEAHNDPMQFLIEGGLPGALLLAAFLAWFAISGWRTAGRLLAPSAATTVVDVAPFAWVALAVLLAGSAGDYPLRTPSIMLYAAVLCVLIGRSAGAHRRGRPAM